MFNSLKKSQNEKKSDENRPKSQFFSKILFLSKIQKAIQNYNIYCDAHKRFFNDIHIFVEVKDHDITQENQETIDKQSNTGARHNGTHA
jgi:hypothetical protein